METKAETLKLAKEVINDIFTLTGQKTDLSEPTVAAALIFSRVVRQAGVDAAAEIKAAAEGLKANQQPGTTSPVHAKRPAQFQTTWAKAAAVAALVVVSAAVGAAVARLMPQEFGQRALDVVLASAIKHQLIQEGGNSVLWRTLRSDGQNAAVAAIGH